MPLKKQVFVAYSYKTYAKADYRRVFSDLEKQYDVRFIFADEKITNMHIMQKIISYIRSSDFSLFDISGWNPNVTLELGFAMAHSDSWYICLNPEKTEIKEVPSDLRGLDRIEYASYDELGRKLATLIEQRYPRRTQVVSIEQHLDELRRQFRAFMETTDDGLTMQAIAQILQVGVPVAQLVVAPLAAAGVLRTTGARKATRYYLVRPADAPPSPPGPLYEQLPKDGTGETGEEAAE